MKVRVRKKSERAGGGAEPERPGVEAQPRRGAPTGGAERVTPARRAAAELLRRVEEEGAFASVLLAHAADSLGPEDRALCYELTLGVLRWQLWLDWLIEHYAGRQIETLDAPVRRALRLGLYQLRFLTRVPASAAVNESVKLTREANLESAASFVNAVLRRATREPDYDPATRARTKIERISISTSHPSWLISRWANAFGAVEAEALARANNRTPPVAFRVNPLRAESGAVVEGLRAAGVEVEASRVAPGAWRVASGGGEPLRALVAEGVAYTQDEASQLVGHVVGARAGERVLDACAAPGSKTTQMGAAARDGATVVAGDLYRHRLRVVVASAARQGLRRVLAVAFDAEAARLPFADESFDRVLIDAPCTGTGTLRHNPEIRWRLALSDIAQLAARQARILDNCARAVRRGGRLVYSTCSVEPEENEQVVAQFLKQRADFRQTRADAPAGLLSAKGAARTWPHRDDADGFYVAVLERAGG